MDVKKKWTSKMSSCRMGEKIEKKKKDYKDEK